MLEARRRPSGFRLPSARRFLLWAFRTLVVLVLLLLLLLGVRDVVRGVITAPARTGQPPASPAPQSEFPRDAAQAFATRFALAYETYDASNQDARKNALQPYLADGADASLGWNGIGKQTATLALPSGIDVRDRHTATVDLAVLVNNGRWIYLAVPVFADSNGQLVVPGTPAILPAPQKASAPAPPADPGDTQLSGQLEPNLRTFFQAYAASSQNELTYYAAPGATLHGLDGSVKFGSLTMLHLDTGGSTRQALVRVQWVDPASNAGLAQDYRLTLQLVGGQWHVAAVAPAGI